MKKGWIIALCVLLLLGAGAGYAAITGCTARRRRQSRRSRRFYEQYQAMLQNAEQTTLTVTENGETTGTYTLSQLGLLEATEQAITAGFTADERMDPAVFAQKSMADKLQCRSQAHTQPGPVRVDTVRYTDEAVVSDLEALPRHPAQDAYMTFADEKFCVVDEVPGNELQLEPVREALREAVSGLTVSTDGAQNVEL